MIQSQGFIIVVSCLRAIQLDGLLEPLQRQIVLLVLEIAQPQIILGWSIFLIRFAGLSQICYRFRILLYLTVAVASME